MKCEKCNSEDKQIKAGKTRAGSQMYKCKICGKVYTPNKKEKCYGEEIKKQAIRLYLEENSGRAVGRILGISSKNKECTMRIFSYFLLTFCLLQIVKIIIKNVINCTKFIKNRLVTRKILFALLI